MIIKKRVWNTSVPQSKPEPAIEEIFEEEEEIVVKEKNFFWDDEEEDI